MRDPAAYSSRKSAHAIPSKEIAPATAATIMEAMRVLAPNTTIPTPTVVSSPHAAMHSKPKIHTVMHSSVLSTHMQEAKAVTAACILIQYFVSAIGCSNNKNRSKQVN